MPTFDNETLLERYQREADAEKRIAARIEKQEGEKAVAPLEPFGYFRSTPFGWEDCAETDEGAKALYEITPNQALEALGWFSRLEIAQERIAELEAQTAQLVGVLDLFVQYEAAIDRRDDVQGMLIYAEFAESARAALAAVKPAAPNVCKWIYRDDPDRGYWVGSCGITWMFPDGNPKENDVHFCPKCGKPAGQEGGA